MNGTASLEIPDAGLLADKTDGGTDIKRVCFVCTGNTCRSPMAAAVLNHYGRSAGYSAVSAGTDVYAGFGIAENAVEALKMRGIEPSPDNRFDLHISRQIDESIVKECDRIIGLTEFHAMMLISSFPEYASKIGVMERGITDPYGGSVSRYLECLDEITECIRSMFLL